MKIICAPNTDHQQTHILAMEAVTIGSAQDNDIVVPSCAAYHAIFRVRNGKWYIRSMTQNEDIYIDDELYDGREIVPGDTITIAGERLIISHDDSHAEPVTSVATINAAPMEERAFCPRCGNAVSPDADTCRHCGTVLSAHAVPYYQHDNQNSRHSSEPGVIARLALIFSLCGPILLGVGWLIGGILSIVALARVHRGQEGRKARRLAMWSLLISIAWVVFSGAAIAFLTWKYFVAMHIAHNEKEAYRFMRAIAITEYYIKYAEIYDDDADEKSEYVEIKRLYDVDFRLPQGEYNPGGSYAGYSFTIQRADENGFICTAVPWKYGMTGIHSFWVDERGVIYRSDLEGNSFAGEVPIDAEKMNADPLLSVVAEELAHDLARAAEKAFDEGEHARTKRIITNVKKEFPDTEAAQKLSHLEKSTDPFLAEYRSQEIFQQAQKKEESNKDAALGLYRKLVDSFPGSTLRPQAQKHIKKIAVQRAKELMEQAETYMNQTNAEPALAILRSITQKYPEARMGTELKERIAACEMTVNEMMEKSASQVLQEAQKKEASGEYEEAYNLYLSIKNNYGATRAADGINETLNRIRKTIEGNEAVQLIDEVLLLDPEEDATRILRLLELLERGYARTDVYIRNKDMLTQLREKSQVHTYITAARDHLREQNYRAALASLKQVSEKDRNIAVTLQDELEECYLHMGDASFESQDYRDALMYYKEYLTLRPDEPRVDMNRVMEANFQLAKVALQNKEYDKAKEYLLASADKYSRQTEYEYMYGRVLMKQEEWENAIQRFTYCLDETDAQYREARLFWAYCIYRNGLLKEDELFAQVKVDDDYIRMLKDYNIVFDDSSRNEIHVDETAPAKKTTPTSFYDLIIETASRLDTIASETEEMIQLDKNDTKQKTQKRTKIRDLIKEIPTQLNVLRASASADSYRKTRILESLKEVHKHFQTLSTALGRISWGKRNTDVARIQSLLKDKVAYLSSARDALEMYTGLEEQRRRAVITVIETLTGEISPTSLNPNVLKQGADDIRSEYASSRETDYAVEGLRALSDAYEIAPKMSTLLQAEPTMQSDAKEMVKISTEKENGKK